jgi:CHAT domain-containing protein/Tfp pilus assembly protein PilF/ketosteroid isomerase-like protein
MLQLTKRVIAVLVVFLVLSLHGFNQDQIFAQADDSAAISSLVERFFAAYAKEDIEGLMSLWSGNATELASGKQSFIKTFADHENIEVTNLAIGKTTVAAEKAKVRLMFESSALNARTGKPADGFGKMNRTMHLVKEQGGWKVSQYAVSEQELAAAIAAADSEAERRALLEADKDLHNKTLLRALTVQEQLSRGIGTYPKSLILYELVREVAERIDDKNAQAVAWYVIGILQFSKGNIDEALAGYEKARELYEMIGKKENIPDLLNNIGQIHLTRGHNSQALTIFQKSLALAEEMSDKKNIAFALNSIGAVSSARGDYLQALDYYRRSLALCEELDYKTFITSPLNNIGSTYRLLGNNVLALEYYQKSLELDEKVNDLQKIALSLGNIGQIHYSQGNYLQALEHFRKALALVEPQGHKTEVIGLEHFIGGVHIALKDYSQALKHYEKSLSLNEVMGQNTVTALTLLNIGYIHFLQGNNVRALEYTKQSLALSEKLGETPGTANAQVNLSTIYLSQGDHAAALAAAERALVLASQIQRPEVLWMSHNLNGQSQRALGRLDRARQSFTAAIDVIEKMRAGVLGGEQDKQRFFEDKVEPYHSMVELLIESNSFDEALLYAERAKGRALLEVLSSGRVNVTKAMTTQEQEQEKELNAELVVLNSSVLQASQQRDQAQLSDLKARLEKARLEYEAFQYKLYIAHPELKVQRGESRPLTITEIERLLPNHKTALLEYVIGEKNSYLFVISRAANPTKRAVVKVYSLGLKGKDLAAAAENFRQQVAARDLSVTGPGRSLYNGLINPAEKQLRGVNELIIVPDGPLWNLPFQALSSGQDRYLLDDFAVSYAPSLSVLREMKRKGAEMALAQQRSARSPGKMSFDLLALGNPVLNFKALAKASLLREEEFGPLPGAELEVNTLGNLYGRGRSKVLTGGNATEAEVKAHAENYRLLHFAAHAVLDDRNPMYSRVMLARKEDGKLEDGHLEAWELMNFDLNAEMVVLSACQTARGRIGAGEGMIGMSWALFVAGSPTVVVSRWKVDSDRTTELMIQFHQNLLRKRGNRPAMSKAEALRLAALKLRNSAYSHPVYWAGFVLIGNER